MRNQRQTKQKMDFRRFLEANREREMTVAEMAEGLRKSGIEMGIATVYRAVKRLEKEGVLTRIINVNGETSYKYAEQDNSIRSIQRIFCQGCGKTEDIGYAVTDNFERRISGISGYAITDRQLIFYGFCENCRKN